MPLPQTEHRPCPPWQNCPMHTSRQKWHPLPGCAGQVHAGKLLWCKRSHADRKIACMFGHSQVAYVLSAGAHIKSSHLAATTSSYTRRAAKQVMAVAHHQVNRWPAYDAQQAMCSSSKQLLQSCKLLPAMAHHSTQSLKAHACNMQCRKMLFLCAIGSGIGQAHSRYHTHTDAHITKWSQAVHTRAIAEAQAQGQRA